MARGGHCGKEWGLVACGCEGQKTSRDTGSADCNRLRFQSVLLSGGQSPSAADVRPRAEFAAGCGPCRPGQESWRSPGVRCGDCVCLSHGARKRGAWPEAKKFPTSKTQHFEFKQFKHGRGGLLRPSEKDLARRGYQWRKSQKAFGDGGQLKEPFPFTGTTREGNHQRFRKPGLRQGVESPERWARSYSGVTGIAPCGKFERKAEKRKGSSWPRQEHECKFEQFRRSRQFGFRSSPEARACSCSGDVSKLKTSHVQETSEIHKEVCERSRTRSGGRKSPLSSVGDWKENCLGQAKELATLPLHAVRHPHQVAEGPDRKGHTSDCVVSEIGAPSSFGWGLEHRLASAVGRGSGGFGKCDGIFEEHGRSQQKCREDPSIQWSTRERRSRVWPPEAERQEGKRKGQGQEGGRQNRVVDDYLRTVFPAKPGSNSIAESLMKQNGSFGRFLKLVHERPYLEGSRPRTSLNTDRRDCKLFPSLLVVPKQAEATRSSRRNRRGRGHRSTWGDVHVLWCMFTFLEGGSPHKFEDQVRLADRAAATSWSPQHASYAGCLHDEIHKFNRLRSEQPLGRGLEQLEKLITRIQNSSYNPGSYSVEALQSSAMEVKPERMSLPSVAGIINPADHLKGSHLDQFKNMADTVPIHDSPEEPIKPCLKISPENVVPVYRKLLDSGVGVLIPEKLALRDDNGDIVSAGLFAVPHKETSDRVICDRRPQNQIERRLVWAKLPHGCMLTQIILHPDCSIRGSGDDLSNYFYLLRHQEAWLHRNCIGQPVSGSAFIDYGCDPSMKYLLCFTVIPMGDANAVDIAQQTHLEILREAGTMWDEEVISYKSPLPPKDFFEGLYIDDHIAIQITPKRKFKKGKREQPYRDEVVMQNSRQHYGKLGIPTSEKKAFTKQPSFQAWGTAVDSNSGRVGTPLFKLKQLRDLLEEVCSLPAVTKKLIQKCLGLVVHPCMHRRNIMCLLQEVYIWVEKMPEKLPCKMPKTVREELLCLALTLPLCHANIRRPVSCRVSATDASLDGGGRACTLTTPEISQTLYRYAVHKGEAVRLDWEHGALAPPSEMSPAPPQLESLMNAHVWNTTHKCKFGHRQHINILELKMVKAELVERVQETCDPGRHVVLVDSRVVAGAYGRGRSSSKQINRILRQMLGWSLVGMKDIVLIWVQSCMNPADHPSRGVSIPLPSKNDPILSNIFGVDIPDVQSRRSTRTINRLQSKGIGRKDSHEVKIKDSKRASEHPNVGDKTSGQKRSQGPLTSVADLSPSSHPAQRLWTFREIFAGCGVLTKTFLRRGKFLVGKAVEIIQHGKVDPKHDILVDDTFKKLCLEARQPRQFWHFGLPCGSFSTMQQMNNGTRTAQCPEGDGTLDREIKGNKIAERTFILCRILYEHNNFFTIENPRTSHAWNLKSLVKLFSDTKCTRVDFDQCEYGLKIPDDSGVDGLARKSTSVVGTLPNLTCLCRKCSGSHSHVQVIGGVKTKGGWKRRSTLAGAYPLQLCNAYHKCCERLF